MKKVLVITLVVVMALSTIAYAANQIVQAEVVPHFTVLLDDAKQDFADASGNRVYPVVVDGSTYLPLRALAGAFGKNINWDASTSTITIDGQGEAIPVKNNTDIYSGGQIVQAEVVPHFIVLIDGEPQSFTDVNGNGVYPIVIDGTTYLPLRGIADAFDKFVAWNGNTSTIIIDTKTSTE